MLKGFGQMAYELIFLRLLKDGPAYGYELGSRFEKMTGGHIKLSWGTIYPILRRMERRGLISSKKDQTSGRLYYDLTARGRAASERLSEDLREVKEDFDEKLRGFIVIYSEMFGQKALNELIGTKKSA